jgi:hypothetical protein
MLSKCANPGCSKHFHYLHEGKLFRMETEVGGDNGPSFEADAAIRKHRHLEFFWLCEDCATCMTVLRNGKGIKVGPLTRRQAAA